VLNHLDPASALAIGFLIFALVMVIMFEATNGFHDAANAVAYCDLRHRRHHGELGRRAAVSDGSADLIAWVFTLPVTILVAGGFYYLLASPKF